MSTPEGFRLTDRSVPEPAWLADDHWEDLPTIDLDRLAVAHPRLVVLSAHPGDETLAVGALISALAGRGVAIEVMIATAGERSHPAATIWTSTRLAEQRRHEVHQALVDLNAAATVRHLNLPDGGLSRYEAQLTRRIRSRLTADTLLLAPWPHDGLPDHDALGRAAQPAATDRGCSLLYYPLWLWHWCEPSQAPWDGFQVVEPDVTDLYRKQAALGHFRSLTDPLGPRLGDQPVVTREVMDRAARIVEIAIDPDGRKTALATLSRTTAPGRPTAGGDPSGLDPYSERRKGDLTVAILGRPRYARALAIGTAITQLTGALAHRVDHISALDAGASSEFDPVHGFAPAIPDGPFDLVVVSEIGSFLTPTELLATLRRVTQALAPGGELVLAHWLQPTIDVPLDGELVHAQAHRALGLPLRAGYLEEDLRIDVWGDLLEP